MSMSHFTEAKLYSLYHFNKSGMFKPLIKFWVGEWEVWKQNQWEGRGALRIGAPNDTPVG